MYRLTSGLLKTNSTGVTPSAPSRILPSRPTTSRLSGIRDRILKQVNTTKQLQSLAARRGALALGADLTRAYPLYSANLTKSGFVMDPLICVSSSSAYSTYY
jgi:hypothetical protein